MAVVLKRRRFTIEEYHRMGEVGILSEDDRVELIEGEIVEMTPIGVRHAGTVNRINHVFSVRLAGLAVVSVQNPIVLRPQGSELQPDVALLRPRSDFYTASHPEPPDVFLVVEVMDTSLERDRRIKLSLYARAGISEAWLVSLTANTIEVQQGPSPIATATFGSSARVKSLAVAALPDVTFTVDDFIGS